MKTLSLLLTWLLIYFAIPTREKQIILAYMTRDRKDTYAGSYNSRTGRLQA